MQKNNLWDKCFYSPEQRNSFTPLHCIEFSEELLELHEAEAERLKKYYDGNKDLFERVSMRQEVCFYQLYLTYVKFWFYIGLEQVHGT